MPNNIEESLRKKFMTPDLLECDRPVSVDFSEFSQNL